MTTRHFLLQLSKTKAEEIDWPEVYAQQLPKVFNYFCYRIHDDAVAEDLTAATFEQAWRKRSRYRGDLGAFSTWLFTIARNFATDYFRGERCELPLEMAGHLSSTESMIETLERKQDFSRLSDLLAQLQTREHDLVALKYGAGHTNRKIAQITGLSESNVGTILNRAVQKIRDQWEKEP